MIELTGSITSDSGFRPQRPLCVDDPLVAGTLGDIAACEDPLAAGIAQIERQAVATILAIAPA